MIVISGLPRSGNHILRALILRCIRQKRRDPNWHGEKCTVWHGAESPPVFEPSRNRFVIPVRNPRCRMLSMRATTLPPGRWPEDACRKGVLNAIVQLGAPVKFVSYEGFVADPLGVGQDLIAWLGYAWVDFPTKVRPLDPLNSPIFDGNAKYSCPVLDPVTQTTPPLPAPVESQRSDEPLTVEQIGTPPSSSPSLSPPSST